MIIVQLFVCRSNISALSDQHDADVVYLIEKIVRIQCRSESRYGLQFVNHLKPPDKREEQEDKPVKIKMKIKSREIIRASPRLCRMIKEPACFVFSADALAAFTVLLPFLRNSAAYFFFIFLFCHIRLIGFADDRFGFSYMDFL